MTGMTPTTASATPALWSPSERELQDSAMARFQSWLAGRTDVPEQGYQALWEWSVAHTAEFWAAVWDYFELGERVPDGPVLDGGPMPGVHWFARDTVNLSGYLLGRDRDDAEVAIVGVTEDSSRSLTWGELRRQVAGVAMALSRLGVGVGDRVVGYLPNIPEAVVAFLATASLGALWSSVGQDYAPGAVVDRFAQLEPTVLIAADGYHWQGKTIDRRADVQTVRRGLPTLRHVVMVAHLHPDAPTESGDPTDDVEGWSALAEADPSGFSPVAVPFEHPLWVLFSSGTTGLPKGLVHGHGGVLIESVKQLALHWDIGPGDRLFWYTSPSWVMWNIQLGALLLGASIVTYDGAPTSPGPARLWRITAEHGVTFLGMSPGFLAASEAAMDVPREQYDLSRLKAMGSTGSPLSPHSHGWAYDQVKPVPLWSLSGGTDIDGAFLAGSPTVPVWPGELSVRCLGVALEAWDERCEPVRNQVGEMVITAPMPSMPIYLWNDPDHERYRDSYFAMFPGIWRHGDWITITDRNSVVIHGRSDSTLNRHGIRMGSADIYAAVESVPEVVEALVIGAEQADGSYWMPLFVVLTDGVELDDALADRLKTAIREKASPRHVPDEIRQVRGIPHTRTGKKLEVPVKRILQGAEASVVAKKETIDHPELLEAFAEIRDARTRG